MIHPSCWLVLCSVPLILAGCRREGGGARTIRYLALGDSYTIGEGVDTSGRWPVQLAEKIRQAGVGIKEVRIVARTGWTTDELMAGMDQADLQGPYDLVTLLVGVNNQYRGHDIDEFRIQLTSLLERARELAGGRAERVTVVSIPDWGVTPFARTRNPDRISREIDAFNVVKRTETRLAGSHFVDITPLSRKAANDSALLASDGLHPSAEMYTLWTERISPVVLKTLGIKQPLNRKGSRRETGNAIE